MINRRHLPFAEFDVDLDGGALPSLDKIPFTRNLAERKRVVDLLKLRGYSQFEIDGQSMFPVYGTPGVPMLALHANAELEWSAPDLRNLRELAEMPNDHPIVARAKAALDVAKGHVFGEDDKYRRAYEILAFRYDDFPGSERVHLF
jgi:hypothetical protein